MAVLAKFFGRAASEGAGFAMGVVAAPALAPPVQTLVNAAWEAHPDMPLDPDVLALGVAAGEIPREWAQDEAARTGISAERFTRMVDVADTGPGVGQAFRLWRRNRIDESGFRRALRRAHLEEEWIDALAATKNEPLTTEQIANAVQQGFLPNPGLLAEPTEAAFPYTPPVEQVELGPVEEASFSGVTSARLQVLAQLSGNPPGPMQLLDMWNRGIVTEEAVERGIREGRTKTKWIPALKGLRWNVLTGSQVVNARLRGWIDDAEMRRRGLIAGYQDDELDLLFKTQGRPLTWRQVWIGIQRGGSYNGPTDAIHPAFLTSLRQSNIRPEWYNLAWHQRYTYPSAFVLRALTADGTFTAAQTETALVDMGWRPEWAKQAAEKWAGTGGGAGEGDYTAKARTQLWTRTHTSYLAGEVSTTEARNKLGQAGVPVAERDAVLTVWGRERELVRKQLTAAQIKKAWVKAVVNRATGAPWTRDDAIAELVDRGYSVAAANEFLDL